jgi:hypothetical protein
MSLSVFFIIVSVAVWLFVGAVLLLTTPKSHKR